VLQLCCVSGEIFSLTWFSKELTSWRHPSCSRINICWVGGFLFPIVLVPRYKLSLCHTPIKPDLLGFPEIWYPWVWVAWPHDHEVRTPPSSHLGYLYHLHYHVYPPSQVCHTRSPLQNSSSSSSWLEFEA